MTCPHSATVTVQMPAGHIYYSKVTCAGCGKFIAWLPHPKTVERRQFNAYRLAKLTMCEGLSEWERTFVESIWDTPKLSPKQQAVLDGLCSKYLEKGNLK